MNRSPNETPQNNPQRPGPNRVGPGPGASSTERIRLLIAKALMSCGVFYALIVTLRFEDPTALLEWLPVHALVLSAFLIAGIVIGCWDHKIDTIHASLGALFALVSGFAALAICQGML